LRPSRLRARSPELVSNLAALLARPPALPAGVLL
jgi:hypothetical protein